MATNRGHREKIQRFTRSIERRREDDVTHDMLSSGDQDQTTKAGLEHIGRKRWYRKQRAILVQRERRLREDKRRQRRAGIMAHREKRQIGQDRKEIKQYRQEIEIMKEDPFTDEWATMNAEPE